MITVVEEIQRIRDVIIAEGASPEMVEALDRILKMVQDKRLEKLEFLHHKIRQPLCRILGLVYVYSLDPETSDAESVLIMVEAEAKQMDIYTRTFIE